MCPGNESSSGLERPRVHAPNMVGETRMIGGRGPTKIDHGFEVNPEHPEVKIFHIADQSVIRWHENKIGSTDHAWWFYDVSDVSKWFHTGCISVLLPGSGMWLSLAHGQDRGRL